MSTKRNVTAVLVDQIVGALAGSIKFWSQDGVTRGMHFVCPCGCGSVLGVEFPPWTWNGDRERPTVTPSIQHMNGCKWHGFLTDGEFREC